MLFLQAPGRAVPDSFPCMPWGSEPTCMHPVPVHTPPLHLVCNMARLLFCFGFLTFLPNPLPKCVQSQRH